MRIDFAAKIAASCAAMFAPQYSEDGSKRAGTTSTARMVRPVTRSKNGGRSRPFAVPPLTPPF